MSFRNHLKYRRKVFKVTNISLVLQLYLFDNQLFNYDFLPFWGDANSFQLYEHLMGRMLIPKKV